MGMDTREAIRKHNIRPTKSLGQNFLTDSGVIRRIVEGASVNTGDLVIEIGPGVGSMTAELASRAGEVVAVEIDKHLIPALQDSLMEFGNVRILNRDIMKVEIGTEILGSSGPAAAGFKPASIKVVANLPYYITTPIIMKLLEEEDAAKLRICTMVFMVQKEVADRMAAKPGGKDYGALSVAVQYYSRVVKLFDVPPHCFHPQPEVESSVVRLDIHEAPPIELKSKELFFKTVKASFGQRRKTLVNALGNSGYFNKNKEELKAVLKSVGIDENQRGETLSIQQFAELSNRLAD